MTGRGDSLAAYRERQRAEHEANRAAWDARTKAAHARLAEAVPGLTFTPQAAVGGFTVRLDDVERWLADR